MANISATYISYGVPNSLAKLLAAKNLSLAAFRALKKTELIEKYALEETQIEFIKNCIKRKPIDENTVQTLLESSNFTCCICKGGKSDGYIIHHIKQYATSQDNEYSNLAVLCPNDHDLAHREGIALTNRLTQDQIRKAKKKWEKEVEDRNVKAVRKEGKLRDIDFINIPRILELCYELFGNIPETPQTQLLLHENLIRQDHSLNLPRIAGLVDNIHTPLMFFASYGSTALRRHYFELLKLCLNKLEFRDIDDLLSKKIVNSEEFVGTYCFYAGGLYGQSPRMPITGNTPQVHLHFRRRGFIVDWSVDPKYLTSTSTIGRLSDRTIYGIYGVIRSVDTVERAGKKMIRIDVRPFAFGSPTKHKSRLP